MNKVLEQRLNTLQNPRHPQDNPNTKDQKSNDFIFKRYRYEENTIINATNKNGKVNKFLDEHQYEKEEKENELENYKKQLEQGRNHFDVIDFGEGDEEEDNEKKEERDDGKGEVSHENPFHFDSESQTQRNQDQQAEKTGSQVSRSQVSNSKKTQQFEVKPMQLVDFQDQNEDQITNSTPAEENIFGKSHIRSESTNIQQQHSKVYPLMSSLSHKSSLSLPKSQFSETFMISPDQSLDGGFGLEESVCNFMRKGKNKSDKESNQQLEKCFSPQNLGYKKYQIHNLSESDNPFKDAVDYSNQEDELKGVKIYQSPHEDIKVQIYDKDLFVSSKIPPGIILKCKLKRSKGFFSLMNPQFDLYLQNGLKHLISARKNLFRNRELFHLSTEVSSFQRPIRTLMANVLHNTYWLVDAPRVIDKKKISYLDLLIEYQPMDKQGKKQRQMTVLCPPALKTYYIGLEYDIPYVDFQWFKKSISLKLYFKGREKTKVKNSEKNFELVDSEDEEATEEAEVGEVMTSNPNEQTGQGLVNVDKNKQQEEKEIYHYLKMQKESENVFDVEMQHPLTPLQAMAIILTRFDAQLK